MRRPILPPERSEISIVNTGQVDGGGIDVWHQQQYMFDAARYNPEGILDSSFVDPGRSGHESIGVAFWLQQPSMFDAAFCNLLELSESTLVSK